MHVFGENSFEILNSWLCCFEDEVTSDGSNAPSHDYEDVHEERDAKVLLDAFNHKNNWIDILKAEVD